MTHIVFDRRAMAAWSLGVAGCRFAFGATRDDRDVPWLEEVVDHGALSEEARQWAQRLLREGSSRAIATRMAWEDRRRELRQRWLQWLGMDHLPKRPEPSAARLEVVSTDHVEGVVRRRVRYATLPGETTEAYWLEPETPARRPRPGVVVFHSTVDHSIAQPAGVRGKPEKAFGLALAKRGFVAFCPRNYLWPTNEGIAATEQAKRFLKRYPRAKGMARMVWEAQLAVDCLCAIDGVDGRRLAAVGHSLGAKEVLYLAAFDDRITASVSSEGGVGFDMSNWDAPWYLGAGIRKPEAKRSHVELLALATPRPFLLVGGDSADGKRSVPYVQAAQAVYRLYGSRVRLGLLNHGQGHAVPPIAWRRILQWTTCYA